MPVKAGGLCGFEIIVDIKAVVEWWLIAYFSTCLLFVKTVCVCVWQAGSR